MGSKTIRQKEIAERTGFSINTVSLALQGSSRISEETRHKILQCAEQLNYIPNVVARSLVQKRTNIIGIILTQLMNPILTETAQEIEQSPKSAGYSMMLMTTNSSTQQEAEALDVLVSRQVDGILMYPVLTENFAKIEKLRKNKFPVILLVGGDYALPSDAVYVNRRSGAYKAAAHLLEAGHQRIGFMCGDLVIDSEKYGGYSDALRDYNIPMDKSLVITVQGDGYEAGYISMPLLYKNEGLSAVLCAKDEYALGAMHWCREQGIRIPNELAFIGFDDIAAARYAEVPLTSVDYDVKLVTKKATELLFKRIKEKDYVEEPLLQNISIDPNLIVRQST